MDPLSRLRTTRVDAALALGFALVGLLQVILFPIAPGVIGELFVLGTALPLAWRRTFPIESSLVAAGFWLIPTQGYPVLGFVVAVLQFFALGLWGAPRLAVALTTAFAAATSVIGTLLGPEPPVAAIGAVLVVLAPVLAGRLMRHQRQQNERLARLTEELRLERDRAEQAAVGAERARIAQELHDVVGHELTLIAIQAEAAAAALALAPDRAAAPVETIRVTAHRTLGEMRQVLDVLAPANQTQQLATEDLVALTDRARATGIPNRLTVTGTPPPSHAPTALAVHRIVQECLTNAGRHASGSPVDLDVEWTPDAVVVRSSNPSDARGGAAPGRGLTGIRHRAELLGGTYSAGQVDGRFDVLVRIPTDREAW